MKESIYSLAAKCERLLRPGLWGEVVRLDTAPAPKHYEGREQVVRHECELCGRTRMTLCVCHVPDAEVGAPMRAFSGFGVCAAALLLPLLLLFGGCAGLDLSGVTLGLERETNGPSTVTRVTAGANFKPARPARRSGKQVVPLEKNAPQFSPQSMPPGAPQAEPPPQVIITH